MTDTPVASVHLRDICMPVWPQGGVCGGLIREVDWERHLLGPPSLWPKMLQNTISIILGSRQPMFVCWGPENHTLYNDGYAQLCGKRHPATFAQPLSAIWPEIWDVVSPMIDRVKAGESIHMDDITFVMHRNGYPEETHFSFSYTPLLDGQNSVSGVFCACAETTERVQLRCELEHERALFGQVFEHAPNFVAKLTGEKHVIELANPAYLRLVGRRDILGKPASEALPEVVEQGFIAMLDAAFVAGEIPAGHSAKVSLKRSPTGPLEDRYVDFVFQQVKDAKGASAGVIAAGMDVTDRVLAQEALAESEAFLRSVIDASPDCIKVLSPDGKIAFFSDGGRAIMEVPEGIEMRGLVWEDLWEEPGKSLVIGAMAQARSGNTARFQAYADTIAGSRRYWDVRVAPVLDAHGKGDRLLAVSRDITYLKQVEDERATLTAELSHRLRNAFGMVQSVINQTLRQASSLAEGRQVLSGRIRALAAAQDILSQSIIAETQVAAIIEAALLPHRKGEGRFIISGPEASINGRQSLGLSLAVHELATNATKYGSLSVAAGKVEVVWDVQPDRSFSFKWEEKDGPVVLPPARNGFGSVLIEKIVATYFNGSGSLEFAPSGVIFELKGRIAAPDEDEIGDLDQGTEG